MRPRGWSARRHCGHISLLSSTQALLQSLGSEACIKCILRHTPAVTHCCRQRQGARAPTCPQGLCCLSTRRICIWKRRRRSTVPSIVCRPTVMAHLLWLATELWLVHWHARAKLCPPSCDCAVSAARLLWHSRLTLQVHRPWQQTNALRMKSPRLTLLRAQRGRVRWHTCTAAGDISAVIAPHRPSLLRTAS